MIISELFGEASSQDLNTLTIDKAGLGLSPGIRSAESLLGAIVRSALFKLSIALIDDGGFALTDEFGDAIELDEELLDLYVRLRSIAFIYQRGRIEDVHTIELIDQQNATNQ